MDDPERIEYLFELLESSRNLMVFIQNDYPNDMSDDLKEVLNNKIEEIDIALDELGM